MNYICELCGKHFSQKSHYDAHKNKKKSCKETLTEFLGVMKTKKGAC